MEKGYLQIYTGDGKGKTTAALGLALRAVCAGQRVLMIQFLKGQKYSELGAPGYLPGFTMEQYGGEGFVIGEPSAEDRKKAAAGLERLREAICSGEYDMVIADELNGAIACGLFGVDEVLPVLKARSEHTELVITGRNAPAPFVEMADLVTEMRMVKHYYTQGVTARVGIEK